MGWVSLQDRAAHSDCDGQQGSLAVHLQLDAPVVKDGVAATLEARRANPSILADVLWILMSPNRSTYTPNEEY